MLECRCWFGGGTAIVLDLDEYRLSKDIDFLCAHQDGYRTLRSRVVAGGASALFAAPVRQEREFRADQYGIRGIVSVGGIPLRFEVVREARITLDGAPHPFLGVPVLSGTDQVAEKLLANADRGLDPAAGCRDAVDLGMLAARRGPFPAEAVAKAERAYGGDVRRKLEAVLARLSAEEGRRATAAALGMEAGLVDMATRALAGEHARLWP